MDNYSFLSSESAPWFEYRKSITKVIIKEGVTSIGSCAFVNNRYIPVTDGLGNDNLSSISIPNTVTSIGENAFSYCYVLDNVVLPDSITSKVDFRYCISLKNVKMSKNSYCYFSNCPLESIEIPYGSKVCSIFYEYKNLKSILIPNTVTTIKSTAFYGCTELETIILPNSVESIGSQAFYNCKKLIDVSIPEKVNSIGQEAFYGCSSLTKVAIPDGVTYIGLYAFQNCYSLEIVKLPSNTTKINGLFINCKSLTNLTIPEGVEVISLNNFLGCENLTEVNLPSTFNNTIVALPGGNKSGFGKLFDGCSNLISINVSSQNPLYSSYDGILYNKDKTELLVCPQGKKDIVIPDSVSTIGQSAFYKCTYLEKIIILQNITTLNTFSFSYCTNLKDVIILSEVSEIPSGCFYLCSNLKTIFVPKTVNVIDVAFSGCDNLSNIYYQGEKSEWDIISNAGIEDVAINYNSRIVTYDYATNGGTSSTAEYNIVTSGKNADLTPTATKAGYKFIGWNTNPNAKTALSSYTVTDDVTLYAIYSIPVTGVILNKTSLSLKVGATETLTATIVPSDATNKNVSWTSSNTSVASVSNGVITARAAGTATITVTTADGGYTASCVVTADGGYTASCTVTVTEKVIDENAPKITISDVKTRPGNEVQVTVDLSNNTGFASLGIEVGYNSDIMTLTNVTSNSGVGGTFTPGPNYTINPFNMGWDSASNITYNGNLATLTFTVNADAPDGVYPVTLDYYKGVNGDYADGEDTNYDENFDAVGFVYISGNVVVASYTPGDLTGDDKVNNKDATYLLRYLAKWDLPDLVTEALDIDGNGSVNNKDATILLRYLAGWDITLH